METIVVEHDRESIEDLMQATFDCAMSYMLNDESFYNNFSKQTIAYIAHKKTYDIITWKLGDWLTTVQSSNTESIRSSANAAIDANFVKLILRAAVSSVTGGITDASLGMINALSGKIINDVTVFSKSNEIKVNGSCEMIHYDDNKFAGILLNITTSSTASLRIPIFNTSKHTSDVSVYSCKMRLNNTTSASEIRTIITDLRNME